MCASSKGQAIPMQGKATRQTGGTASLNMFNAAVLSILRVSNTPVLDQAFLSSLHVNSKGENCCEYLKDSISSVAALLFSFSLSLC